MNDRTGVNIATADPMASKQVSSFKVSARASESFSTRRICALQHNFHEHPLMQMPRLAKLAEALHPKSQCRFITPGATETSKFFHSDQPSGGHSIGEVFRRIEEPGSWVAMYDVQTDPDYRDFLDEVMASVRSLVTPEQSEIFKVAGFIFISAPPSVTPFHIDRENNFWLQVKGQKVMNVWDHADRDVVNGNDIEEFILTGGLENVKLATEHRSRAREFRTGPGDGVYFPSTSPHMTRCDEDWAKPGDGVSVSIGVVFYTNVTRLHANVHAFNRVVRKLGGQPREPGQSEWLDRLKYPLGRAASWGLKRYREYPAKEGF
jgi:hypothetical protein